MIVNLEVAKLKSALVPVLKVVKRTKKGYDPVYSHVQWNIINNTLILSTYDAAYGVEITYGSVEFGEDIKFLVEAEALYNLLMYTDQEVLSFDIQEDRLIIDDNNNPYEFNYYITDVDHHYIFTSLPEEKQSEIHLTVAEIKNIYQFLGPCIASDVARTFLCGIYFDGSYAATNSEVLGVVHGDIDAAGRTLFLLEDSIDYILALNDATPIELSERGNVMVACSDNIRIVVPQVGKKFPQYSPIIEKNKKLPYSFQIEKAVLSKVTQKLLPFADKNDRLVSTWTFTPSGSLIVQVASKKSKKGKETIVSTAANSPTEDKAFFISISVIAKLVESFPESVINIRYGDDSRQPIHITDASGKYSYYASVLVVTKSQQQGEI